GGYYIVHSILSLYKSTSSGKNQWQWLKNKIKPDCEISTFSYQKHKNQLIPKFINSPDKTVRSYLGRRKLYNRNVLGGSIRNYTNRRYFRDICVKITHCIFRVQI